jgi:7-cyano-7-deazaguanine reductase
VSIEVIYAESVDSVSIRAEFEAVCPLTKTVDHYELTLTYVPRGGRYLELQSFRRYLDSFRGVEVFHEALAAKIAVEVCRAVGPEYVRVELRSTFLGMGVIVVKTSRCADPGS